MSWLVYAKARWAHSAIDDPVPSLPILTLDREDICVAVADYRRSPNKCFNCELILYRLAWLS